MDKVSDDRLRRVLDACKNEPRSEIFKIVEELITLRSRHREAVGLLRGVTRVGPDRQEWFNRVQRLLAQEHERHE